MWDYILETLLLEAFEERSGSNNGRMEMTVRCCDRFICTVGNEKQCLLPVRMMMKVMTTKVAIPFLIGNLIKSFVA